MDLNFYRLKIYKINLLNTFIFKPNIITSCLKPLHLKFANYYEVTAFDADHHLTDVVLLRKLGRSTVKIFCHSTLPETFAT